jgi:hypothetical protein
MPAELDPEALRARLERARLAQANIPAVDERSDGATTATFGSVRPPTRGYLPEAPAPHPALHRLHSSPQPSLPDRFRFNEGDGYDNTLVGAAGLLPPQMAPTGRMSQRRWADLAREAAERRKAFHRREQFPLPAPKGAGQWAAAALGQLAAQAQSPENWIWRSPANIWAALAFEGLMGAGPNLLAQDMQTRPGLRDKVSVEDAVRAGTRNIAMNRAMGVGDTVLRGTWRLLRPELEQAFSKAGDPLRNFEAWQYLKNLLQRSPVPPSNSGNP